MTDVSKKMQIKNLLQRLYLGRTLVNLDLFSVPSNQTEYRENFSKSFMLQILQKLLSQLLLVMVEFFPQFPRKQSTSIHAKVDGSCKRNEEGGARHVLHANLHHRLARLPLSLHARSHHEPSNIRLFSQAVDAETPPFLDAQAPFGDGDSGGEARVGHELELIAEVVGRPALPPRFEAAPWLPAADGDAVGAEDQPGARV